MYCIDERSDLSISISEAEDIIQLAQNSSTQQPGMPLTQSAATIISSMRKFSTRWSPLDKLLNGGLVQGHVLEISGPPGTPKESVAVDITCSVLEAGEGVIFSATTRLPKHDFTFQTSKPNLSGCSSPLSSLKFIRILNATELMVFLHSINTILESMPKMCLLVLNSLSFPFSTLPNPRLKSGIMAEVKQILTQLSVVRKMTVVITSQLATTMVKEDGTRGTFDEGAKGVMTPQLGPSYLPQGRSHRVILSLESPLAGTMHLLSDGTQGSLPKSAQQASYSFPPQLDLT
ncbi:hypothetical protein NP233_g3179 [Leucocoprinus birnbaumii]|uniref:RecA family profile 1 domain-containing protein n=1 Tax=Leucocoprinus birnbaumii TaxID=56174 RepID=A0AAD5YY52_9AGAR|nr:hypothetical protein NP233_g3179 [Leucocoprinus birnbaumii]